MHPPPTSLRETVLLFADWQPKTGVAGLFEKVNWARASRRQIVHAFFDRPPANAAEALEDADFNAQALALELFASPEFRGNIALRLMRSFPAKRRLLFVHLPKSAGTDFGVAMQRRLPSVHLGMESIEVVPQTRLEREFNHFARLIATEKYILMRGHIKLGWFLDQGVFRFHDRLIAILRHPHEICVSMINYILHRFRSTPDLSMPDTRAWSQMIGMTHFDAATVDQRALALSLATRPGIQPVNPICSLLGEGTAASALDNLARAPIELTTVDRYSVWLKQSWDIERERRENVSPPVITWADLTPWQQSRIEADCAEDRIVYEAVMTTLARRGGLSVTGPQVVADRRSN